MGRDTDEHDDRAHASGDLDAGRRATGLPARYESPIYFLIVLVISIAVAQVVVVVVTFLIPLSPRWPIRGYGQWHWGNHRACSLPPGQT